MGSNSVAVDAYPDAIKVIIDTDPGIDDSMTILMALQSPDVEVVGLTTIFGNVSTNSLLLGGKPRIADFVHGSDGLGNLSLPPPAGKKIDKSASEFMVETASQHPGEISILALGPLTNLALIYGDPEAADVVFTSGANIVVVGINITTQVNLTDDDLSDLRNSRGRHSQLICDMCKFYSDWHVKSDGVHGIFLHDPVSFAALVRPELFTYRKGVVRVETQGICAGHTLMDQGLKVWNTSNPWTGHSPISVAWTVDVPRILEFIRQLLMKQ